MSRIDNCTLHLNLTPSTVAHGRSVQLSILDILQVPLG
jgi:hypothetical protein